MNRSRQLAEQARSSMGIADAQQDAQKLALLSPSARPNLMGLSCGAADIHSENEEALYHSSDGPEPWYIGVPLFHIIVDNHWASVSSISSVFKFQELGETLDIPQRILSRSRARSSSSISRVVVWNVRRASSEARVAANAPM